MLSACGTAIQSPSSEQRLQTELPSSSDSQTLSPTEILANPLRFSQLAKDFLANGEIDKTRTIIDTLLTVELTDQQTQFNVHLLTLELELKEDTGHSFQLIEQIQPINPTQRLELLTVRAKILKRQSNTTQSISVLSEALEISETLSNQHRQVLFPVLWQTLVGLAPTRITELDIQLQKENLRGWFELALIYNTSMSESEWKSQRNDLLEEIAKPALTQWFYSLESKPQERRKEIALLLPQSGAEDIVRVARSIRDGWLQAHFENAESINFNELPNLTFFDTSEGNPIEVVQHAFDQGADFVVGPLNKEVVDEVARHRIDQGQILLLNDPTTGIQTSGRNINHVAWTIEDEALALARHVSLRQDLKCVQFAGTKRWMQRARAHFDIHLPDPEKVLSSHTITDYLSVTDTVGTGLGVEASQQRHKYLQEVVRYEVAFRPRLNDDVNCVVAFIDGDQLDAILQSLRYHSDNDLAIFVTESAFRGGIPDNASGVVFPISPWLLYGWSEYDQGQSSEPQSQKPFRALGFDAYQLANRWASLSAFGSLKGLGGLYQLSENGAVERIPELAEIEQSEFRPYQPVPSEDPVPYL